VHPPGVNISIQEQRTVLFHDSMGRFSARILPIVINSKITAYCYLSALVGDYLSEMFIIIINILRARIDLVSFHLGTGTTISVNRVTDVDGRTTDTNFGSPVLRGLCTSFSGQNNYDQLLWMVTTNQSLGLALDDLILAAAMPNHIPVNCARVVDGIRNLIAGDGANEDVAWEMMRSALNVDLLYVKFISDLSKKHRHAKRVTIEQSALDESLKRSWKLMDRYFHLIILKVWSLPIDDFPPLLG
jgi:hypothetical protein